MMKKCLVLVLMAMMLTLTFSGCAKDGTAVSAVKECLADKESAKGKGPEENARQSATGNIDESSPKDKAEESEVDTDSIQTKSESGNEDSKAAEGSRQGGFASPFDAIKDKKEKEAEVSSLKDSRPPMSPDVNVSVVQENPIDEIQEAAIEEDVSSSDKEAAMSTPQTDAMGENDEWSMIIEHETDFGGGEVDPKYIQEMPAFDVTITGIDDTLMGLIDGDVEGLTKAVNELLTSDPYYGWTDKVVVDEYEDAQKMGCCRIFLKVGDEDKYAYVKYRYETKTFETNG